LRLVYGVPQVAMAEESRGGRRCWFEIAYFTGLLLLSLLLDAIDGVTFHSGGAIDETLTSLPRIRVEYVVTDH
jgi:hypothetical protein